MRLKSTLEQWNTLRAIDEFGSIQAASIQLNKSHTTLIYSIKKLENQLDHQLVEVKGRKTELTHDAKILLRHASSMLDQAKSLEVISAQLSKGTESEIRVTIDHLCDKEILYRALKRFISYNQMTSVKIIETSLTSTIDAVTNSLSDIAIINLPVKNFPAEALGVVTMIPVTHKSHPLADTGELTMGELITETQIVLRDLGGDLEAKVMEEKDVGWLKSKRRITVDTFDMALEAVKQGLGFTRIPQYLYERHLKTGVVRLKIQGANSYNVPLHITLPKGVATGTAALELYDLILEEAKDKDKS